MLCANAGSAPGRLTQDSGHYDLLYQFEDFQNILSVAPEGTSSMAPEVVPSMAPAVGSSMATEVVPPVAPEIRLFHQMPEPALLGNRADPWPPFDQDVMAFIPGISYTSPVDPSFYGAGASNVLLPGPDMHGPTFSSTPLPPQPPPPQPLPKSSGSSFRRSVWQDETDYGPFSPVEPCTTEPMKQ